MIQNKTIKIDDIQSKLASTGNEKITLVEEKDKYNFYRVIKGEDGEVYKAFKNMDVKKGDVINVGYIEEDDEFTNREGQLIKYKKRSIISLREGDANNPLPQPMISKTMLVKESGFIGQQNNTSQNQSDDKFWDKKAYKQCLWGFWLQANKGVQTTDWKQLVWDAFNDIEKDADLRFATGMEKARAIFKKDEEPLPEELPKQEEINVDDIPF